MSLNTSGTIKVNQNTGSQFFHDRDAMPEVAPRGVIYLHNMQPKTADEIRAQEKAVSQRAAARKRAKQARKRQRK